MTDEADRAEAEIERDLAEALRRRRPAGPEPTGWCLYCGEPLAAEQRWCVGTECRAAWEWEEARRAANADP